MATRLLIDAAYSEETRVVVVSGTRLDEFDFESSKKKQLKGNIYLAKVMRVEPSLQAAFVDYGGNRHGFLAFADIHPDYYQIPVADKKALLEQRAAEELARRMSEEAEEQSAAQDEEQEELSDDDQSTNAEDQSEETIEKTEVEAAVESEVAKPRTPIRRYKIQEVIKRRQVLLIQVSKEERGSKGAALTTYVSLAGRYCVLMPNTARGGGVSRKISIPKDRKRLRDIIDTLGVPEGMGLIVRTAGQERTKADIRRDFEYLLRVWNTVRDLTLESTAPSLVYEEADLIKRSIRDLYSGNISEVLVEGEDGYKLAKSIMKMFMPSHAKRVQKYSDRIPLFHRYQVEQQLDQMHNQTVQLRSGGYIVINSTEALVAIDVNSGRSTRERNIEATALKTNLEAAEEIARQLRLRDLAGLVVVDFIDMEISHNNRSVEKKLKDSLKVDRARIQVGRISLFGLLELSRQRMRTSFIEASTESCQVCEGTGLVRSTESSALHIMRAIEDEGIKGNDKVSIEVPPSIATYLLNQKRSTLSEIELRLGISIAILTNSNLHPPSYELIDIEKNIDDSKSVEKNKTETKSPTEKTKDPSVLTKDITTTDALESAEKKPSNRRRRGKRGGGGKRQNDEKPVENEQISSLSEETISNEKTEKVAPEKTKKVSKSKKYTQRKTKVNENKENSKNTKPETKIIKKTPLNTEVLPDVANKIPKKRLVYKKKTNNKKLEVNKNNKTEKPKTETKPTGPKKSGWWSKG